MALPTLQDIFDKARADLGDVNVSGGQVFKNTVLLLHAQSAVRILASNLRNIEAARVISEVYTILPKNTTVLSPATANAANLNQPIQLRDRGNPTTFSITGAVQSGSSLNVTCPGHTFQTGQMVALNGIGGLRGAEGLFGITASSGSFTANGVVTYGTYTSGGTASYSPDLFGPPIPCFDQVVDPNIPSGVIAHYAWRDGRFWFPICSADRQLKITYLSDADVPSATSDVVSIDDSLDFLGSYTAAKAGRAKGYSELASNLMREAVGSRFDEGIVGGRLEVLNRAAVLQSQDRPTEERWRQAYAPVITRYGY